MPIDHSLIPFGKAISTGEMVEICDVPRGMKCACTCPSCGLPLIAKHGPMKAWHFTHVTRGVKNSVEKECDYSFWPSVHLMAKQIILSQSAILLPAYKKYDYLDEVEIAHQIEIKIERVKIDTLENGQCFDSIIYYAGFQIGVLFTSPAKNNDHNIQIDPLSSKLAVLEISLEGLQDKILLEEYGTNFHERIKRLIRQDLLSKSWRLHPRELIIEKKLGKKLSSFPKQPAAALSEQTTKQKKRECRCIICKETWFGDSYCRQCKTHLYVSNMGD